MGSLKGKDMMVNEKQERNKKERKSASEIGRERECERDRDRVMDGMKMNAQRMIGWCMLITGD